MRASRTQELNSGDYAVCLDRVRIVEDARFRSFVPKSGGALTHGLSQKPHVLELGGSVLLCRLKHGSYAAHRPSTIWADQIPSNEVRPVQLRRRLSRWSRCWCSAGLV